MTLLRKAILVATTAATLGLGTARLAIAEPEDDVSKSQGINHIVVIYEENHSFDNLYGNWEGVNGLKKVKPSKATQVNQAGTAFSCLLQNDVNLTSPPLASSCNTEANPVTNSTFNSAFTNAPFQIDNYITPNDTTCPPGDVFAPNGVVQGKGLPGGCTRDIVHRFYQEQYQINGGKMNRYVTGSDAAGLTMGYYDTKQLPIYKYLHQRHTFGYAIADNFFQSAFGGSFLNHQWLIAAQTPIFPSALSDGLANDLHSVVDANGFPNKSYPLYTPTTPVNDSSLTVECPALVDVACGDYAINTIQPTYQPFSPGTADAKKLPPQIAPTIGDRLSEAKVSWAWYSGGWSNANGDIGDPGWTNGKGPKCSNPNAKTSATYPNCPDNLFQFHHQPFNYYANFAPDTQARKEHLRDEQEFFNLAQASTKKCNLYSVNFIKPIGAENEHPGYASERVGSNHLVGLLEAVQKSACAKDTMIIVTYDEFGGQWDHVPPPGQGNNNGPHDEWGPGTRIPALIISPQLKGKFVVDHKSYDTTSILATIERRFGLKPLNSRDAKVNALSPGDDRD